MRLKRTSLKCSHLCNTSLPRHFCLSCYAFNLSKYANFPPHFRLIPTQPVQLPRRHNRLPSANISGSSRTPIRLPVAALRLVGRPSAALPLHPVRPLSPIAVAKRLRPIDVRRQRLPCALSSPTARPSAVAGRSATLPLGRHRPASARLGQRRAPRADSQIAGRPQRTPSASDRLSQQRHAAPPALRGVVLDAHVRVR